MAILEPPNFPDLQLSWFSRSSVDFSLDRTLLDALGTDSTGIALRNRFLDATNEAFYVIRDFIGGAQYYTHGRMEIRNTRGLPRYTEGWSGWPIFWQLHDVHNDRHLYAIDHARMMRATGAETTEIPIHEIGHNFDNFRWSFETEAFAIFFTYHYYSVTGRHMVNAPNSRVFRGGEFREYMRSHALRGLGQINHNEALRRGVYSPYSMVYVLGSIAGQIGWQPFTETFRHFQRAPANQLPNTDIGRLNHFMSLLQHHSGRDVIGMIPATQGNNARAIFEQYFGGAIQYVPIHISIGNAPGGTITMGSTHQLTASILPGNVANRNVTWSSSNNTVATISSTGLLTARNAGRVTITVRASASNVFAQLVIDVTPSEVLLTFDGNGGTPLEQVWRRAVGRTIGTLPTVNTRRHSGLIFARYFHFIGWFDTQANMGGTLITPNTDVPNSDRRYWARWTDPDRHVTHRLSSWWPRSESGITNISMRKHEDRVLYGHIEEGVRIWNNLTSQTGVHFYFDTASRNTVEAREFDFYDFGVTYTRDSTGTRLNSFQIELNTSEGFLHARNIDFQNFYGLAASVMAHELGHVIGLDDDPVNSSGNLVNSIMNGTFVLERRIEAPLPFDVDSVRMIYN
ncbi:MAG: Ig-like domain-containing protein [Oscillospiraceae bacterium]|nr:Ig-like domain-containing protein [Oscillospiraceae bacterium]